MRCENSNEKLKKTKSLVISNQYQHMTNKSFIFIIFFSWYALYFIFVAFLVDIYYIWMVLKGLLNIYERNISWFMNFEEFHVNHLASLIPSGMCIDHDRVALVARSPEI